MINETNLYREIHEQPTSVGHFLQEEMGNVARLAKLIQERNIDHVVIAARGTSDNAGRYAKYLLGAFNGMQVALATPSLYSHYDQPIKLGNALVLGISQSGQSPDIVSVLAEARRQGKLTAAITNFADSPLAQEADVVIQLQAGDEKAVAATKTYTASLAAIAALSVELADDAERREWLYRLPELLKQTLQTEEQIRELAPRYRYMKHCVVIGRGFNYATAFELALKLKELTYSIVEPYSSADFLHGPFAILERGFPVILLAPSGRLTADLQEFAAKVQDRGAELIAITDDVDLAQMARIAICLPASVPEWLSPITTILPGQQLALFLAHTQGNDVDAPRALNKVTETL